MVGAGRPGPITKRIQQTYFAAVRGEIDRYKDWLEHVR
jgi:branched-chain amino acid aminotransferase